MYKHMHGQPNESKQQQQRRSIKGFIESFLLSALCFLRHLSKGDALIIMYHVPV